eukprot:2591581-Amphidinium_carterae.2
MQPVKLTVLGNENVAALQHLNFHVMLEIKGASCTDLHGCSLIVSEDVATGLRVLPEVEVCMPEPLALDVIGLSSLAASAGDTSTTVHVRVKRTLVR